MRKEQLKSLEQQLRGELKHFEDRLTRNKHFGLDQSFEDSTGDLTSYDDNHPADMGTEMFEREKDSALNDLDEEHLRDIKEALSRMGNGTYGYCKECHKEINFERLQALPYAQYCIEHAH